MVPWIWIPIMLVVGAAIGFGVSRYFDSKLDEILSIIKK